MAEASLERQVRAVLESLQMQSPKQAFNICEKYLKKNGRSPQLLAIKALLLVYMGKDLQGIELAKELVAQNPTDITTLGNLDKVFVTANDYKASTSMFEEAFKSTPTEDVGALWFFSVLRTQDTKMLFSIALKLHSMFKGTRYLFWAILALQLQTRSPVALAAADGKTDSIKALKLAEKMILKAFTPEKIYQRSLEELLLLIMVLQGTENYQEALRVLDAATGIAFPNNDERELVRADLMEKNGHWDDALEYIGEILTRRGIFDWNAWKLYLKAVENSDRRSELVGKLLSFIESLGQLTDKRSFMLAHIDIRIVFDAHFSEKSDIAKSIICYIREFEGKGCCLPDMQHTSASLTTETLAALQEYCSTTLASEPTNLLKNLTWLQLERIFRLRLLTKDPAFRVGFSLNEAISSLEESLSLVELNTPGVEKEKAGAAWMHLAILYIDRGEENDMLRAVWAGRCALDLAPDNFSIKLLLMLTYLHMGSVLLALDLFRSLDIKQLQLDTLAYLISDHLLELGDFEHAELFFHESFFIYDENRTQSWSLIAEAFSRGSYSNVPEFYEFARRLEYSMQAVACICGTIRTELLTKSLDTVATYLEGLKPDELLFEEEFMLNLSDNRDRDVVDFVDHTGVARIKLLNKLPTFGRTSILIYTFVPVLLRSLLKDYDDLQLPTLLKKFTENLDRVGSHPASTPEIERLCFVKSLITIFNDYVSMGKNPQALIDGLSKLLPTGEDVITTEVVVPHYAALAAIQWELEREHWIILVVAFLLHGSVSGKSRRQLKTIAGPLLDRLESISSVRSVFLEKTISELSQLNCPVASCVEQWSELALSWKHSFNSFRAICNNSIAIIHTVSNREPK